jgi:hypothetical protein
VGIRKKLFEGKEKTMTATLALDTDGLQGISDLPAEPVLRQAATFLADLVKPGASASPGEFDTDRVGGYFDDLEEVDGWARHFYGNCPKSLGAPTM